MSYFIPFFNEEELIDPNLSGQACLKMKFQGKHLVRYLIFAKRRLRRAINICQTDIAAGLFCVLTESDTHVSIWREQPSERPKVRVDAPHKLQPQLHKSQLSRPKEKEIASASEAVELVDTASPPDTPDTNVRHLAAVDHLEPTVEYIDTASQSDALQHSILTASKIKTSNIYSTPGSPLRTVEVVILGRKFR